MLNSAKSSAGSFNRVALSDRLYAPAVMPRFYHFQLHMPLSITGCLSQSLPFPFNKETSIPCWAAPFSRLWVRYPDDCDNGELKRRYHLT